ncbi:hypothetical protein BEWA_020050 [Theileria equi strain WA]|uniref:RAP domain-containing protein n=1 Tax=Theileria equi strain WA TaxID=1537102 RepID=L0AW80_THEEQ|nr:hypothetical protein BEWA_020050 [Theileria equi strain WA]AFZ79159.1 hypothetical protein BEWA_020050 [Theileria equi strain WA]|eukprot:XP_004828825.1 hypothetical protein BEWA_020050 [Theileria equi strain WA]
MVVLFGVYGNYTRGLPLSYTNELFLSCKRLAWPINDLFNVSAQKRAFAYYRFHKRVGKGNWNRYIERYNKPRTIENTQRLIFNYRASFQAAKGSLSYLWELPKKIASATTSNEVFEAWVYYRHKKKKLYHYVLALRRLTEIGHVDISDWRFNLIITRLIQRSRYFLDLPNVCRYLGSLKATSALDKISTHLCERISYYSPNQVAKIADAFGTCRLHNKYLFSIAAKHFEANLNSASNDSIIIIAKAFGNCMVYNFKLLKALSLELQRRLSNDISIDEFKDIYSVESKHSMANICKPENVTINKPKLEHIVGLAESFASLKLQDFSLMEILSSKLVERIQSSTYVNVVSPYLLARCLRIYRNLKINDISLFKIVLKNVHEFPYNYPPACVGEICNDLSSLLPKENKSVEKAFEDISTYIRQHLSNMKNSCLANVATFIHKAGGAVTWKKEFLGLVANTVVDNNFDRSYYDIPKLMEILSTYSALDENCFQILSKGIYHIIDDFEPCDFVRISRVLREAKKKHQLENAKLVNMIAKHLIEHHQELSIPQYHCAIRDLTLSGSLQTSISQQLWALNR